MLVWPHACYKYANVSNAHYGKWLLKYLRAMLLHLMCLEHKSLAVAISIQPIGAKNIQHKTIDFCRSHLLMFSRSAIHLI